MKNGKLAKLYRLLTVRERKRFRLFLESPYYNKNEFVLQLFVLLDNHFEEKGDLPADPHWVARQILPVAKQNRKELSYLQSELLKQMESFLGLEHYLAQPYRAAEDVLAALLAKKAHKHFDSRFSRIRRKLEREPTDQPALYEGQYGLSRLAAMRKVNRRVRSKDYHLQQASDNLDHYYFLTKLQYSCEMLNRERILSIQYDDSTTPLIMDHLAQMDSLPPLLNLYYHIYKIYRDPKDFEAYQTMIELVFEYRSRIDRNEARTVFLYALNHCLREGRQPDGKRYWKDLFTLYDVGLEERYLFQGKYISHWTYTNAASTGLSIKEYEWTERIIYQYRKYLEPATRDDPFHFMLANLNYHKGEYEKVLNTLRTLRFVDLQYHLEARLVLMKTFYDIGAMESLLSLMASFSTYLRRNKQVSPGIKMTYLNFCNLLHQILKIQPAGKDSLKERIRETQPLTSRSWLLKVYEDWESGGARPEDGQVAAGPAR